MHVWFAVAFFFLAPPFWQVRPPERWTDLEIEQMLGDSPWAQRVGPTEVVVYLATAAPIEEAEAEERRRGYAAAPQPDFDYSDYVRQRREEILSVAIPYSPRRSFGTADQQARMEAESEMKIGRKSYKILGNFPPTQNDPVLRLIFPRKIEATDKTVLFRLYLPGIAFPEREVEFRIKDLFYQGKLQI
jgi:hypothetical protein